MLSIQRLGFGLLAILLTVALSNSTGSAQTDLLAIVQQYQILHNLEMTDETMALFSEDAEFEIVGQGVLPYPAIRAIHDYDRGINTRLAFINCEVEDNTVTCQTVEFNGWLEAAGLQPIFYTSSVFAFDGDKIARVTATMSAESAQALNQTLAAFVPWLMQARPEEASLLFSPEGLFIYSEENGERVVSLLYEWRSAMEESE